MQRVCRVSGVSWYVRRGGFAWQSWRIVAACALRWVVCCRFEWRTWGVVEDVCVKSMVDVQFACRMHIGVGKGAGLWIRVASVVKRAF